MPSPNSLLGYLQQDRIHEMPIFFSLNPNFPQYDIIVRRGLCQCDKIEKSAKNKHRRLADFVDDFVSI